MSTAKEKAMTIKKKWRGRLVADESGHDLMEYALVAALVGLGTIATSKTIADSVHALFTYISTQLNAAVA